MDDVLETQALCKQYEGYIAFSGVTLARFRKEQSMVWLVKMEPEKPPRLIFR